MILVAAVSLAGCGRQKSFVEADAIWRDEVAKLEELEREFGNKVADLYYSKEFKRAVDEDMIEWMKQHPDHSVAEFAAAREVAKKSHEQPLADKYGPLIEAQQDKVNAAAIAKEAAK